jgi:uncharacterized membrane protein
MSPATGAPSNPPDWEILVSHHAPARYARTFGIRLRRRTLHVCARCSGQLAGLAALVVLLLLGNHLPLPLVDPRAQVLIALAPLPAAVDWATQTAGGRESNNAIRLISGALLGFAFTDAVALLVLEKWTFFEGAVLVFGAYVVALLLFLFGTGAWRSVLREHFPGIDSESPP